MEPISKIPKSRVQAIISMTTWELTNLLSDSNIITNVHTCHAKFQNFALCHVIYLEGKGSERLNRKGGKGREYVSPFAFSDVKKKAIDKIRDSHLYPA
jgi:hypothetical protein